MKPGLKVFIAVLGLVLGSVLAQDVRDDWEGYLSANEALQDANGELEVLEEKMSGLREEIAALQEKSAWYSRWIIKMRLAGKSAEHVQLSNSLGALEKRVRALQEKRSDAFDRLSNAYRVLLDGPEGSEGISETDKEIGESMVRLILSQEGRSENLPQYGSLLEQEFRDERMRTMVLNDLKVVVASKLGIIDSLLSRRRSEQELVKKVNQFHRSIAMQSETDFDSATGVTQSPQGFMEDAASSPILHYEDIQDIDRSADVYSPEKTSLDVSGQGTRSPRFERGSQSIGGDPIQSEIDWLNSKRQEYARLLARIRDELAD